MFVTREKEDYADIVNMPRPEPKNHRRMPMIKRAAVRTLCRPVRVP